jgi:hypothetical protein
MHVHENVSPDSPHKVIILKKNIKEEMCIQGVPGGKDLTSGECSLSQTIPI